MTTQRGRPIVLPAFNPNIPKAFLVGGSLELYRIDAHNAVSSTKIGDKLASLKWLALYNKVANGIVRIYRNRLLGTETVTITHDEHEALLWAKHKGKYKHARP